MTLKYTYEIQKQLSLRIIHGKSCKVFMYIYLTLYADWQLGVRRHAFKDCRLKVVYQDHFDDKPFGLVPFCVENM